MDEKMEEMNFFFSKMFEDAFYKDGVEMKYYFSAFITSVRSITDIALEDANILFRLSIPDSSSSFRRDFKKKVGSSNNHELKKYYTQWNTKRKKIDENPFVKLRHIIVHRGPLKINYSIDWNTEVTPGWTRILTPRIGLMETGTGRHILVMHKFRIKGARGDIMDNCVKVMNNAEDFVISMKKALPKRCYQNPSQCTID